MKSILAWFIHLKIIYACRMKWKLIFEKNVLLEANNPNFKLHYYDFWKRYSGKSNLRQARVLSQISGWEDVRFLPEELYYTQIEPALNKRIFAMAYADKNFYEHYLKGIDDVFPVTWIRGMNGDWFDRNYSKVDSNYNWDCIEGDLILKPSIDTSGGANVQLIRQEFSGHWKMANQSFPTLKALLDASCKKQIHFVLQERIVQNDWFASWNSSSLNTIRLMTYRSIKDNSVHPLGAVIRFGKPGSLVDNQAAGGLTCGVLPSGQSGAFVCDKYGKFEGDISKWSHLLNTPVPGYFKMIEIAKKIGVQYPYHRLLGFDFAVDVEGNIKLLEINCKNIEINFIQMNTGPLFSDLTEEVVSYCEKQTKQSVLEINFK
jgi:hypothetical protein